MESLRLRAVRLLCHCPPCPGRVLDCADVRLLRPRIAAALAASCLTSRYTVTRDSGMADAPRAASDDGGEGVSRELTGRSNVEGASASLGQPDYWWSARGLKRSRPCSRVGSITVDGCSTSAVLTVPAPRGRRDWQGARRWTLTHGGSFAAESAHPQCLCPLRPKRLRRCALSTSWSIAHLSRLRCQNSTECPDPADACCSRFRPMRGHGASSTWMPDTIGGTRSAAWSRPWSTAASASSEPRTSLALRSRSSSQSDLAGRPRTRRP